MKTKFSKFRDFAFLSCLVLVFQERRNDNDATIKRTQQLRSYSICLHHFKLRKPIRISVNSCVAFGKLVLVQCRDCLKCRLYRTKFLREKNLLVRRFLICKDDIFS